MAGPVFCFQYLPGEAPTLTELEALARRVVRRASVGDERPGSIGVDVEPSRLQRCARFEQEALAKALGAVPSHEVSGYAMAKQEIDWKVLRAIATEVAERYGGLAIVNDERHLCGRRDRARVVEARDVAGAFGAFASDPAYVAANLAAAPCTRWWIVDARDAPGAWVIK